MSIKNLLLKIFFDKHKEKSNTSISNIKQNVYSNAMINGVDTDIRNTSKITNMASMSVITNFSENPSSDLNIFELNIPQNILNHLWIKGGALSNYTEDLKEEPSLIDLSCPVNFSASLATNNKIGYYPSYIRLSPSEKGTYLKWLCDISQEIDIGYVFIFYYGLERYLLSSKYKSAADIIMQLRKFHKNASFLSYSADALFIATCIHKDTSIIKNMDWDLVDVHFSILASIATKGFITPKQIMKIAKNVGFANTRYIKIKPYEFEEQISKELLNLYGEPVFKVSQDKITDITKKFPAVIANYSLRTDKRIATFPDIFSSPSFSSALKEILQRTHNSIKYKNKPSYTSEPIKATSVNTSNLHRNDLGFNIKSNTIPENDNYALLNDNEYKFLKEFKKALEKENMCSSQIILTRLGDKTFNVDCAYCYIGKIRLIENYMPDTYAVIKSGASRASKIFYSISEAEDYIKTHCENIYHIEIRKGFENNSFYMHYFIGSYDKLHEIHSENLQDYIDTIPRWIRYIKYCKRF